MQALVHPLLLSPPSLRTQASLNTQYWRSGPNVSAGDGARMAAEVAVAFPAEPPFAPAAMAVVTWFGVKAQGRTSAALNTFQAALGVGGDGRSFVTLW